MPGDTLKDAGIKQIYVTDAMRTQQTAAPLAKALKIKPTILPAKDPNALIKNLVYTGGGNILVVGHSDTVPFVIARLQGGTVAPIGENEYDRMFVMTIAEAAGMPASTLHYCSAGTPPKPRRHRRIRPRPGQERRKRNTDRYGNQKADCRGPPFCLSDSMRSECCTLHNGLPKRLRLGSPE